LLRPRADADDQDDEDRELVHAIASGIGQLAHRRRLRESLRETRSQLEVGSARHEVAEEFRSGAGDVLSGVWRSLSHGMERTTDPEVIELLVSQRAEVGRALMELQAAEESLAVLRGRGKALEDGMRDLLDSFAEVSEVSTSVRVVGQPRDLPAPVKDALYAVLFEALSTIAATSRASAIVVTIAYGADLSLSVRDDGVGLGQRAGSGPRAGMHYGLRVIRDRAAAIGGSVSLEPAEPRGTRLTVRIPAAGVSSGSKGRAAASL
jgi:signal transduction histidine kinase